MPNKWVAPKVDPDSAADFVIDADSDDENDRTPLNNQAHQTGINASSNESIPTPSSIPPPANQAEGNSNSFFNFTNFTQPKIDLSSTFRPLASNSNITERQYSGGNTLDEPVLTTLLRDINNVGTRLKLVIWPASLSKLAKVQQKRLRQTFFVHRDSNGVPANSNLGEEDEDEDIEQGIVDNEPHQRLDWDLWGPLVFSLAYSIIIGLLSSKSASSEVFSGSFTLIWITFAIISLNIQLLGGNISFFSAISATGYSLFPIVIGAIISIFVKWKIVRLIVDSILISWSIYSATVALKCSGVLPGKVFLAMYPVGLVYSILGWLCVIT